MNMELVELLIHKELTNEISDAERIELKLWLSENESNKQVYEEISTLWEMSEATEVAPFSTDLDAQLAKLQSNIAIEQDTITPAAKVLELSAKKSNYPWMKIAAGFVVLLGAVMLLRTFGSNSTKVFAESTGADQIEQIEMLDGSVVLMNEASKVTFFPHVKTERRLKLEGEAFFDVARNESKPFIIETNNAFVRVLGTSFSVKSSEDAGTFVSVRSGKVMVESKQTGTSKILTKGQEINLNGAFGTMNTREDLVLNNYNGLLDFDNTNLKTVFTKLRLKFGKQFIWDTSNLANCELNGNFEGKSLDEILEILETVYHPISIEKIDDVIKINGGQCN